MVQNRRTRRISEILTKIMTLRLLGALIICGKVICNIISASTVLWKCNLDPNTNDRKNAIYL